MHNEIIPEENGFFLLHLNKILVKNYRNSLIPYLVNAGSSCIPIKWKVFGVTKYENVDTCCGGDKENGISHRCYTWIRRETEGNLDWLG